MIKTKYAHTTPIKNKIPDQTSAILFLFSNTATSVFACVSEAADGDALFTAEAEDGDDTRTASRGDDEDLPLPAKASESIASLKEEKDGAYPLY